MSTAWTEQVMAQINSGRQQVFDACVQYAEDFGSEPTADVLASEDFRAMAAFVRSGLTDDMVQAAHAPAWLGVPQHMGGMNRPFGKSKQERFLARATYAYIGMFAQKLGEEAQTLIDASGTSEATKRQFSALRIALMSLMEAVDDELKRLR